MPTLRPSEVRCACGQPLTAWLADRVDVDQEPELRTSILSGELHRVSCPACSRRATVEHSFWYVDRARHAAVHVHPRGARHLWRHAEVALDDAAAHFPDRLRWANTRRVAFGMDELREKLVAQDLDLDDRFVEVLKVFLLYEHPVLMRRARLRLTLHRATNDTYEFVAAYEHHQQRFCLRLPRRIVDTLWDPPRGLKGRTGEIGAARGLLAPDVRWVNIWRLSPQPTALDRLREYGALARDDKYIDVASDDFRHMLEHIPTGLHLPSWAKRELRVLFDFAGRHRLHDLMHQLAQKRFRFTLEDDWSLQTEFRNFQTLWDLLDALPDAEVEGNTKIREILLNVEEGISEYRPSHHDIGMDAADVLDPNRFARVLRHEVGHAVHEMLKERIDDWLMRQFGWQTFAHTNDDAIDAWVRLMGGWGDLTADQRHEVCDFLRRVVGNGGKYVATPTSELPEAHPWHTVSHFGPRLAYEGTKPKWFEHTDRWHRADPHAFFLDYYGSRLVAVNITTLPMAGLLGDIAMMSANEFFAQLYAYYRNPASSARTKLASDVLTWLDDNLAPADDRMTP